MNNSIQLDKLQRQTFNFFWNEANPENGLVADRTAPDWPAGTASTGFALTCIPVAVERGFIPREKAAERTLTTLRFFSGSKNGPEPEAAGYRGFFYKFLDMSRGRRAKMSEISVLDSAILFAGALTASQYFDRKDNTELEISELANELYSHADWQWTMNNGLSVSQGWKPETGFIKSSWKGYDEGMLVHILGLGSPSFSLPDSAYKEWTSHYESLSFYGYDYLYAGPLFIHLLPHVWIDFRGIKDDYMQQHDSNYFENSVKATMVQYQYASENPEKHEGYGEFIWGITISDGPGPAVMLVSGNEHEFYGTVRRGVPFGPDDGTISPWAQVACIAFAPEIVIPAIDYLLQNTDLGMLSSYGFRSAFNPSFPHKPHNPHGWRSPWHYGTNQGPAMAMIENYRTGLIWNLLRENRFVRNGLLRAGFSGGWLGSYIEQSRIQEAELNSAHLQ